jgi:hypothetical protein
MRRLDLVADCSACDGLCCVATAFDASDDFAFDKAAGVRCRHLTLEHRCSIHAELAERGCSGCVLYDCYGAGQRATRAFAHLPVRERHEAFLVLKDVHELIWMVSEAMQLCPRSDEALCADLAGEIEMLDRIEAEAVVRVDVASLRAHAHSLLHRVGVALGGRAKSASR